MLGRKFFKTKLCKLFQGGRCPRENCSFAHGSAELRHAPAPFNDRRDSRDYRSVDLRDKLDRRPSPHRRYSPGRDGRGYHGFPKPVSHDRGYSVSRSPVRRRHRKKQHLDGESNDSGSFKVSHGTEDQRKDSKEEKVSSQDEKVVLEEQLKKIQLEIESLDEHKSQLEKVSLQKSRIGNITADIRRPIIREKFDGFPSRKGKSCPVYVGLVEGDQRTEILFRGRISK